MITGFAIVVGLVASIDADIRYLLQNRLNKLPDSEIARLQRILKPEDEEYEFLPKAELWLPSPSRED